MIYDKHNKNMKLNIDDFYAGLNDIISFDHSNNDKCCKKAIRCLLSNYPNLDQPVRFLFRDKGTTSKHLCRIADALIVIYKHSFIDDTKDKISDLIIGCYARSFILAPFRERHKIAFDLCCYISLTYYTYYTSGSIKVTNYSSHLEDYFSYFSMKDCDPECNKIYKTYLYKTSDGKAYCYSGQRVAKLMQWYILQHIKNVNEINQNILGVDSSKIQNEIDECYSHLCNIEKHKIKKLGYGLFYFLLCDYSDEDNFMMDPENEYWENRLFVYNQNDEIEFHVLEDESLREAKEEYEEYLQSQMGKQTYHDDEINNGYGKYRGSYAQDELGYSDEEIDTLFDGDPSAYWNID